MLKSRKDKSSVSLVCKEWYNAERWSRRNVFIGNCYSVSPEILTQRFPNIRSVTLKGKPRFSDFNLVPANWGVDIHFWLVVFAEKYLFLEELRLKRMTVIDESLKFLVRSFPNFKAISLQNCDGFSTDGLAAIAADCKTLVFLVLCVLFRLTCELQRLRFEGVHKLFEGCSSDASLIFGEHVRIRKQLWLTSHRYRFFIIGCLVTITVSQLGALLLVLASISDKTFFNSGDLLICSAVQLSGFMLCLVGAARITHRAQGIVAIATRWHLLVTNASCDSQHCKPQIPDGLASDNSDSDSSDIKISVIPQQFSMFQTRQSLVTYLQHNKGGITLYGFTLDRGLLHTLFAFELSLVLWILSRVVVLS